MKTITDKMKLGDLTHDLMSTSKLTPARQKNIQTTLLPILLCSYAKDHQFDNLKHLCTLQADLNMGDYDGNIFSL